MEEQPTQTVNGRIIGAAVADSARDFDVSIDTMEDIVDGIISEEVLKVAGVCLEMGVDSFLEGWSDKLATFEIKGKRVIHFK